MKQYVDMLLFSILFLSNKLIISYLWWKIKFYSVRINRVAKSYSALFNNYIFYCEASVKQR